MSTIPPFIKPHFIPFIPSWKLLHLQYEIQNLGVEVWNEASLFLHQVFELS